MNWLEMYSYENALGGMYLTLEDGKNYYVSAAAGDTFTLKEIVWNAERTGFKSGVEVSKTYDEIEQAEAQIFNRDDVEFEDRPDYKVGQIIDNYRRGNRYVCVRVVNIFKNEKGERMYELERWDTINGKRKWKTRTFTVKEDLLDDGDDYVSESDGDDADDTFAAGTLLCIAGTRHTMRYRGNTYTTEHGKVFKDAQRNEVGETHITKQEHLEQLYTYGNEIYSMVEPGSGKTLIVQDKEGTQHEFGDNENIFEYVKLEKNSSEYWQDLTQPAGAANKYRLVSDNEGTLTLRGDDGGEISRYRGEVAEFITIYNVGDSVATEDVGNGFTVTKALDPVTQMYTCARRIRQKRKIGGLSVY